MIKRLQLKIIAVVFGTLLTVFAAVILVLNLSVQQTSEKRAEDFMISVIENDGFFFPPRGTPNPRRDGYRPNPPDGQEIMRAGRFFYAKVDQNGNVLELNLDMMFDFTKEDAQDFIAAAWDSHKVKGSMESFSFLTADKSYGRIMVFAERSIEINLLEQLIKTSLWIAVFVSLVLLCLAAFLSKWMVGPIKAAFDKQRRFISDVSHELKTPLTIIGANVDVLQNEIGDNQRLTHIRAQSERMNGLVHDLLALTKADERPRGVLADEFNLSSAVLNTTLEFESRVFEERKQYSYDIAENVMYTGDKKQIRQLLSILIDNALHYSEVKGQIKVSLCTENNCAHVSVYNTGIGVSDEERSKIFERFYRTDESRSRAAGGYGVGLSIAKAIVDAHKGKITVSGEYGKWIRFDVKLT